MEKGALHRRAAAGSMGRGAGRRNSMWQEKHPTETGEQAGQGRTVRGCLRSVPWEPKSLEGGLGISKSEAFESDHSRNARANQGTVPGYKAATCERPSRHCSSGDRLRPGEGAWFESHLRI